MTKVLLGYGFSSFEYVQAAEELSDGLQRAMARAPGTIGTLLRKT